MDVGIRLPFRMVMSLWPTNYCLGHSRSPGVYTALAAYLFPIRIYEYRKKSYSLFLYDLCCESHTIALSYMTPFSE